MDPRFVIGVLAGALGGVHGWAAAEVQVRYQDPASFAVMRDAARPSEPVRRAYLDELKAYLERRAASRIADGDTLVVTITDLQLAGLYDPLLHPPAASVRIVRDVTPARIDLRFTLARADGTALREGERKLRSVGYPLDPGVAPADPLRYEKALLDDWLRREFPR
ncbi:MAG: DUF3016 domain-containing protein [Burkholderiales bacterium]